MSDQDIKSIAKEMSMAEGYGDDGGGVGMDTVPDLLNWNNLAYTMPITNSVTSARNMKEYKPQRRTYECVKNDTIIVVVETGAQYVDWRQSYLTFDLEIEKTEATLVPTPVLSNSTSITPTIVELGATSNTIGFVTKPDATIVFQSQNHKAIGGNIVPKSGLSDADRKSYLPDETENKASTKQLWFNWGYGSCKNLFRSIVVTSRSGVELQRIDNFNRYAVCKERTNKGQEWFETKGVEMGYEPISEGTKFDKRHGLILHHSTGGFESDIFGYSSTRFDSSPFSNKKTQFIFKRSAATKTKKISFSIPMSCFGGIFDTGQLCPASICSGLRIELRLEDIATAMSCYGLYKLTSGDNIATGIFPSTIAENLNGKISNMRLNCDTHLLNDAAMRELNRTSAQNGLEYVYTSVFGQSKPLQSSNIDVTVSKSVSRAISAMGGCFLPYTSSFGVDNFTTVPTVDIQLAQYQWRLGSMYFPHAPFTTYSQFYSNLLYSVGQYSESKVDLSPSEFKSLLTLFSATFERSNLLRYSGVPINNSRTLSCAAEFFKPGNTLQDSLQYDATPVEFSSGAKYDIHVWLDYVSLAKAFLNNIVVSV